MRVHVISGMEGVAGIVTWEQTTGGASLYEVERKLYTEEINAAVRGGGRRSEGDRRHGLPRCRQGLDVQLPLIHEDLDPSCEYVIRGRRLTPLA